MRLAYVYDAPMPDRGADTEQVVNTAAALARRGVELALLLPGPVTGQADPGPLLDYYQVEGTFALWHLAHRYRALRPAAKWSHAVRAPGHPASREADLVYTRNLPAVFTHLSRGRPVAYEHFRPWGDQFPVLRPWLRSLLTHPRLVACVFHSEHTRRSFLRLGVPPERVLVAHNGWDPRRLEPRLDRAEARARLDLPPDRPIAVYTGRLNRAKGLDVLLAAARECPEGCFVLVGSEGEGPVEAEARALPNTLVVPWQRFGDLGPWLYAADVLIVPPSLAPLERHGNTVLPLKLFLYLAAGRAVLAPRAPDTAELLVDGVNAALVPPGDPAATAAELRRLFADPARARRLGEAARRTAQSLTWDARAERIERFLRERMSAAGVRG